MSNPVLSREELKTVMTDIRQRMDARYEVLRSATRKARNEGHKVSFTRLSGQVDEEFDDELKNYRKEQKITYRVEKGPQPRKVYKQSQEQKDKRNEKERLKRKQSKLDGSWVSKASVNFKTARLYQQRDRMRLTYYEGDIRTSKEIRTNLKTVEQVDNELREWAKERSINITN
jgi:hypothetical protein